MQGGLAEDGLKPSNALRRPADVWVPRGLQGDADAFDFAIFSGLRSDIFRDSTALPEAAIQQYEESRKISSARRMHAETSD